MKSLTSMIAVGVLALSVIIAGWGVLIPCGIVLVILYVGRLLVKALKIYIQSSEVREEKKVSKKALGEVIKGHRTEHKMTQEFVAEYLGVSRQAVSKWESGLSDPSTSNLIALSKLFDMAPEELLKEAREQ